MSKVEARPGRKPKVAVVYHIFAHYRQPVSKVLSQSDKFEYDFWGDDREYAGIAPATWEGIHTFHRSRFFQIGKYIWQYAAIKVAMTNEYDAIIYLGNPNFLSTWLGAAIARIRGKRVLFWTHGWLRREPPFRTMIRNLFYSIADQVLVYGERAKEIGVSTGFSAGRISVIYNSLNFEESRDVLRTLEAGGNQAWNSRKLFKRDRPTSIFVGRLIELARVDVLLKAAALIEQTGEGINIVIVGEGPERANLEDLAKILNLDVHFFGECYDENIVGSLIYSSDMLVSPGKIGLAAIHSLMYGTPVITHDSFELQMPEVEVVVPGVSGEYFARNDVVDLARAIARLLEHQCSSDETRRACRAIVEAHWTPQAQGQIIDSVMESIL